MLGLAATVLVSLGREKTAMAINAFALALLVSACAGIVPTATFGGPQLVATATATSSALAVALAFGIWRVRAAARAFVPWKTALRVGACVAGAWFVGGHLPVLSKPLTILAAVIVGVGYVAALVAMRELGKEDLAFLLSLARRRSARS
jgi:stage V sporulation protein B